MSSRTPAASAPTASAKTTAAATSTAPRPDAVATNETDTIIEELKALAQSMLDATNAARSRAQAPDKKRSYEALMSAIEGRGLRPYPGSSSSADGSSEANGSLDVEAGGAAHRAIRDRHGDPNNVTSLSSRDIRQPRAGANGSGPAPAASTTADALEAVTDIPAALTPQYKLTATNERGSKDVSMTIEEDTAAGAGATGSRITSSSAAAEEVTGRRDPHEGSLSDAAKAAAGADAQEAEEALATVMHTRQKGRAGSDARSGSAETGAEDEEEDNVYDGVRTQVLFKSTDARAYREVVASAWKPERLLRAADGTSEALNDDEDDDDADGGGDEPTRDRDGEIDDDDVIVSVQRRAPQATAQRTKVLRVPSFPFGGGITQDQFKALRTMFNKSIRSVEAAAAAAATDNSTAAPQQQPLLITKSVFESADYQEVKADVLEREASFRPTSPYQFVVEVEQDVVFDAVRAREQRRKDFRRLAKEGRAPVTMGTFDLRIIMDPFKTGFEDEKNFPIVKGAMVADRYQVIQLLGKATFSRAVRCYDLHQPIYEDDDEAAEEGEADGKATADVANKKPVGYVEVCLKIINNTKDFFDQSLDEIRLLQLINKYKDADEAHVVRLIDAFYYKEHTMLVTELLSDNLYEFAKYNREEEDEFYFTLPRLRRIARQVTEALAYVHSLNLIHTDLKPENILFLSHRRCIVKVIDFGSSCFLSDHLSSYIQSRSYRAPEVILGADYDGRIDVWSLGAILVELVTGDVLFTCETVPEMLARMVSVCGLPFPRRLLWEGRHTSSFINKFGGIYESAQSNPHAQSRHDASTQDDDEPYYVYTPVPPSPAAKPYAVLREKLAAAGMNDSLFFSFVKDCLCLDHKARKTSAELLSHPFIVNEKV